MAYQITLSEQDYAALAAAAVRNGTAPEHLLHDLIQSLHSSSQSKRPVTARGVAERQFHAGKISHVPTRQPLTAEEREARERRARRYSGGKSAADIVIEDRGPY